MQLKESSLHFYPPSLRYLNFKCNDDFIPETFKGFEGIEATVKIRRNQEKDGSLEALVILNVVLGKKDNRYPFYIEAEISSYFYWSKEMDNQSEKLLNVNAPALLFSYLRPYIAMVTNASGFPACNLPFIDFTRSSNIKTKKEKIKKPLSES